MNSLLGPLMASLDTAQEISTVRYAPFRMERYQSTYEHHVRYNLSESGGHPLTVC